MEEDVKFAFSFILVKINPATEETGDTEK